MSTEHLIAAKYARALLFLAQEEGKLDEVESDLELLSEIFGTGEGRDLLVHPLLSPEQKQTVIKKLVYGQVSLLTFSLLRLLVEKRRGSLVSEIAAAYREALQQLQGCQTATVTAAIPFNPEQLESLRKKLSLIAGAQVELTQVVEPELRGGARITMGDLVLDGSIGARLEQLRRALAREASRSN